MPNFEEISQRIMADKRFASKLLVGGLISFVPILNIVILGYLQEYTLQIRKSGNLVLPSLERWWLRLGKLFVEGLLLFVLLMAFSLVAGAIGWSLYNLASFILFGLLSSFLQGWLDAFFRLLPVGLPLLLAPPCSAAALYLYQSRNNIQDLLRLDAILRMLLAGWKSIIFPSLFFVGLMIVGAPLYGFAFFLGFSILLAYFTILFGLLEKQRDASAD